MAITLSALRNAARDVFNGKDIEILDCYRVTTANDTEKIYLMECRLHGGKFSRFCYVAKSGETAKLAAHRLLKAFQLEQARYDIEHLLDFMAAHVDMRKVKETDIEGCVVVGNIAERYSRDRPAAALMATKFLDRKGNNT